MQNSIRSNDQEIFRLMLHYIDKYKNNKITEDNLTFCLLKFVDQLKNSDHEYNGKLFSACINLETSFVMYEEEAATEKEKEKELNYINQYLNEIITLINQKLIPQK